MTEQKKILPSAHSDNPTGKPGNALSSPFAKIFPFTSDANHFHVRSRPIPREGRWPSSQTLGLDAVDAAALLTNGANADGQVVWS